MPCALEIIHGGSKQEHVDLALQQQQTSYLNYHNAYGHQTWQGIDLSWGSPTNKITWPFDHVVLQYHVTNQNHYNSTGTTKVAAANKRWRMVSSFDGFLPMNS